MTEWVARLPLRGSRSVCTCRKLWKTFDSGKHLIYFFFFFFYCTLQFSRIIVQYSVIVGRNLETNLTPTMTIFFFFFLVFLDSIDQVTMTKQYENEVSSVAFQWCRCSSQSIVVHHFYSQLVLPPYTVKIKGGRHSTTHGEGSSRWALVLPPNTIKTRRGRSTLCQAHVLPPHAVKTRGGRSTFYHGHGQVHFSSMRLVTSVNHSFQVLCLYSGSAPFQCCQTYLVAPWSPLRRQNQDIQKWDSNWQQPWGDGCIHER